MRVSSHPPAPEATGGLAGATVDERPRLVVIGLHDGLDETAIAAEIGALAVATATATATATAVAAA